MKLIDRYVTTQVLLTSFAAIAVLSVVLVLGNVFKQLIELLVNHNAPLELIISFVAYILPFSLTFTIPWGFLTAVLLVFGKMSAENELIALRSTGVSVPRICLPVFVIALVSVGICLWINLDVAPRAQVKMKDALYNIATSNPIAMFGSDKVIEEFPKKKIYVERNEGPRLHNVLVYELDDEFEPVKVVHAQTGELTLDQTNNQLLLRLFDARYEQRDQYDPENLAKIQVATARETTFPISLQELMEKNKRKKSIGGMTASELLNRRAAEQAANASKEDRKKAAALESAAKTEINKRFSFSLASFAFALFGVPLAITAHRRETSVGFLLSLGIGLVYIFMIILVDTVRSKPDLRPELLIWGPNVLFLTLGVWLFARMSRR